MGVTALSRRKQIHISRGGDIVAVPAAGMAVAKQTASLPGQTAAAVGADQKRTEIHKNLAVVPDREVGLR
jgi:hypothetical protein